MTQQQRVARDTRGERTTYESINVGDDLGTIEWSFGKDEVARICESDDDFHEWYSVDSPYGGTIAPMLINYPPIRMLFSRKYNVRGLFYWYECESYQPLRPDTKYRISGRIADKWIKRDREYVKYEATCFDPAGAKVFWTARSHVLDFLSRNVPKTAVGIDSGAGGHPDVVPPAPQGGGR